MRPSEQIALTVRDFDEPRGILSVTKARVLGIDKDTTKTREDRIIQLSPRALGVLKRQLALYRDLKARRVIEHNQLFFKDNSTAIRTLGYPAKRWRLSLERLGQRYRRPYSARHSSVSWNLMIGKNPLFVARQHGHSLVTMWRTYAAWMDGAIESDIGLIRAAIDGPAPEAPELAPSSVQRDSPAQVGLTLAERPSNTGSRLPPDAAPGDILASCCAERLIQADIRLLKKWRRGWDYSASPRPFGAALAGVIPASLLSRSADLGRQ